MAGKLTPYEKKIIGIFRDKNIEFEDALGIMVFLERSEEKHKMMLEFLNQNPNADYQDIMDKLYQILDEYDGETNIEWGIN